VTHMDTLGGAPFSDAPQGTGSQSCVGVGGSSADLTATDSLSAGQQRRQQQEGGQRGSAGAGLPAKRSKGLTFK